MPPTTIIPSKPENNTANRLLSIGVLLSGLLTIAGVLLSLLHFNSNIASHFDSYAALIVSVTFIYLASLLRSGKRAAWAVCIPLYIFLLARNIIRLEVYVPQHRLVPVVLIFNTLLSSAVLFGLVAYKDNFVVRSQISSVTQAAKRAMVLLLAALLYGSVGFQVLDKKDFHEEITYLHGLHYTVDQFGLTTEHDVTAHTRRGEVFLNSLSVISSVTVLYVMISFFSPIKARFGDQTDDRQRFLELLRNWPGNSEDFFKLWPHDKLYFIETTGRAGLAYTVENAVALVVGGLSGNPQAHDGLMREFLHYSQTNDWQVSFVHITDEDSKFLQQYGFNFQKIGEEAVVGTGTFVTVTAKSKYFRQIRNRFAKSGYSCDYFTPPHHPAVVARLDEISASWCSGPGRTERGFMMGYFEEQYLQQCDVMVARDAAGTIQAFMNRVPSFDQDEANFDFLRHSKGAAGNINDFLLMAMIEHVSLEHKARFNLGLCPLAGLDSPETSRSVINSTLQFVYSKAGRFYSFAGLRRFKSKYDPVWRSRYIGYTGGLAGFTKTAAALNKAMKL